MDNNLTVSNPINGLITLLRVGTLLLLSLTSIGGYSAEETSVAPVNSLAQQTESSESENNSANTDEFCMVEAFSYFVDWVEKAIKRIEGESLPVEATDAIEKTVLTPAPAPASEPAAEIEEGAKVVLDLTIPEFKYEGTMGIDKGQKLNFPDLFSAKAKKPYSKESPSSSFGGRLLMDDAELESMEEYRLNDVREAVRGAEVSLEFKTN